MSQQADYASVIEENAALKSERDALKRQLAWFKKQVFGEKSERRLLENDPDQLPLSGLVGEAVKSVPVEKEPSPMSAAKPRRSGAMIASPDIGLRFDDTVPVEVDRGSGPPNLRVLMPISMK